MKAYRILACILCVVIISFTIRAQETTVKHKYYTVSYSVSKHIPTLVKYILKKGMSTCSAKRVSWKADPDIPGTNIGKDYTVGCGYEKGHNMPHQDNSCNPDGVIECFYYSNCYPQTKKLNTGSWKTLENRERAYAEQYGRIKIFIGHIGEKKEKLGTDKIAVPQYCWKVIYVNKHFEAYIFPNTKDVTGSPDDFRKPSNLKKIEQECNLNFLKLVTSLKS